MVMVGSRPRTFSPLLSLEASCAHMAEPVRRAFVDSVLPSLVYPFRFRAAITMDE